MLLRKPTVLVSLLFLLLTYPLFYYAYKFGSPDFGNIDFYEYYPIYKDLDFSSVESPFNSRIISPFLVYLFYKTGIFYNAKISFFKEGYDQRVFFSAIAVNYIFFVAALIMIFHLLRSFICNQIMAFFYTLIYGYSFATLFYTINTLTESVSVFMFAIAFFLYLKRNLWIIIILFLSIFQREYILMTFSLIAFADYFLSKERKSFFITVFIGSILFFLVYLILRKTVFYTPHHAEQLQFDKYFSRLLNPGFPIGEYIRQSFLNQNIFLIYLMIVGYKLISKIKLADSRWLVINLLLYVQINLISVFAVLGNSTGRYFSTLLPLTFYALIVEANNLINPNGFIQKPKN